MTTFQTEEFDLFISYQWDIQNQVEKLEETLLRNKNDLKIWRDVNQLRNNSNGLYEQLASGIRNSRIILCLLTKKYVKSANCKLEINYSFSLKKTIVYVMVDKMSVDDLGEVGFLMGNSVYIQGYKGYQNWVETKGEEIKKAIFKELNVRCKFL